MVPARSESATASLVSASFASKSSRSSCALSSVPVAFATSSTLANIWSICSPALPPGSTITGIVFSICFTASPVSPSVTISASRSSEARVSRLGSPRVPMSVTSSGSSTALSQVSKPLTSATPTGSTPSDTRYSAAFHSVAATRVAGPSRVISLPRESVRVMVAPVDSEAPSDASSVVPQAARAVARIAVAATRGRRMDVTGSPGG